MIRVAHLWRGTGAGGSEATFVRLYQALDRQQIQFDFIVENTGLFVDRAALEQLGARVFIVPPITRWRAYRRAVQQIFQTQHYQIVHAHLNELSVLPLRLAKRAGVPVRIAHAHSGTNWREPGKALVKSFLRPWLPHYATHYWAVSAQAGQKMFGRRADAAGRVTLLPNAVDLPAFAFQSTVRATMRQQLDLGNNQIVIGHVGRLVRQKNQIFLLRAFARAAAQNPRLVLLLVGDGPLRARLYRLAQRLGISHRVRLVGDQRDIAAYYQAMDAFVLPSLYEGSPAVALEAQANGLPCLLATTITRAVQFHANVQWLGLGRGVRAWAAGLLHLAGQARDTTGLGAANQTYNVAVQAKNLCYHYTQMVGGPNA